MPTNLVRVPQYVTTITHPDPGDLASASQLKTGVNEILADATRFLFLDASGARVAGLKTASVGGAAVMKGVTAGFDATDAAAIAFGAAAIRTSPTGDDSSWTGRTVGGGYSGTLKAGTKSATRVVLAGDSTGIQSSDDGVTWTARTAGGSPATTDFTTAVYAAGTFVLIGTTTTNIEIQTSTDGATWTHRSSPLANGTYFGPTVVYHQGRFIASVLKAGSVEIISSVDGVTWTSTNTISDSPITTTGQLMSNGTRLVVAAMNTIYWSDDLGASWQSVEVAVNAGGNWIPYGGGWARGLFVLTAYRGTSLKTELYVSDTGDEWFQIGTFPGDSGGRLTFVLGRWWHGLASAGNVLRSERTVNL